jgi:hypothetical protein
MSYRKIYENRYGKIPSGYEIHHIDGNHKNNNIENLKCVSVEEHYRIHLDQGDYMACSIIALRLNLSEDQKRDIHKMAMHKRDQTGKKNPMYGRSAILENNMKWYHNGFIEKMFIEDREPEGYIRGRIYHPEYDKSGKNNPRAKKAIVNGKTYDCLKSACLDYPEVPYSTMKYIARSNKINNKYGLEITYA